MMLSNKQTCPIFVGDCCQTMCSLKETKCPALGKCWRYPFGAPANAAAFEVDPVNRFPE